MRLSDIKGERTFDVIAEIIEPIAEMASDPKVAELFAKKTLPEGMSAKEFAIKRITKAVPSLMKNHKKSLVAILAAINGEDAEAYTEKLNLVGLVKDCAELLTDDAFVGLFTSAQTET